jgi:hypothetical protein
MNLFRRTMAALAWCAVVSQCSGALASSLCDTHDFSGDEKFLIKRPLAVKLPDAKPEVIGGTVADVTVWPATMIFCPISGEFCTSTAVGPRVVLTAAHCLDHVREPGKPTVKGALKIDNKPKFDVKCTIDPDYQPFDYAAYEANGNVMKVEWSADLAVCLVESDIQVVKYERLMPFATRLKRDDQITLLGLGCTEPGGGGTTETLYAGPAPVKESIAGTFFIHTQRDPNSIRKEAALCKGDSGGAGYKSFHGVRSIVAIASLSDNLRDSWLTNTTLSNVLDFVRAQTGENDFPVCGLHPIAAKCQ